MIITYYVVYEITNTNTNDREEISKHKTLNKAISIAKEYMLNGGIYTIDAITWEVTKNGRETIDCDSDIWVE